MKEYACPGGCADAARETGQMTGAEQGYMIRYAEIIRSPGGAAIMRITDKIRSKSKEAAKNRTYIEGLKKPVWEKAFLLEGGQGRNINGNAFAMLRCIRRLPEYDDYDVFFSVMPDITGAAEARCRSYGFKNVTILVNGSDEYKTALARSKYLITDNSFSIYFLKRDEQVYVNTWHGTPLKALGRTDLRNSTSLANVQSNFLKADYLLHPNTFTRDIMMKDYMVERLFGNRTVVMDYPRNDALYSNDFCDEIRERYGLEGKRLIAYMPTWRGTGRNADIEEQTEETRRIITEMSGMLHDDEVLCVNLHFLLGSGIDIEGLDNVMMFPQEYETYDFLAACDTLITDYSSVSVDFAGTGREIILYIYDYEKYKQDKGFYLDVTELPFRKAYDPEQLEKCLHSAKQEYGLGSELLAEDRGHSSERLLDLMVKGKEEGLDIQDYSAANDTCLAYFENISREADRKLLELYISGLSDEEKEKTVIAFENAMRPETIEVLAGIDRRIDFIRIQRTYYKNRMDFISTAMFKKRGLMKKAADRYYEREARRLLESLNIRTLKLVISQSIDRSFILSKAPAKTVFYEYPAKCYPRNRKLLEKRPGLYRELADSYDETCRFAPEEIESIF